MNACKYLPLIIAAALAGCGEKAPVDPAPQSVAMAPAATAPAIPAPTAAPAVAAPAAAPGAADLVKGEKVYTATCLACHGSGVLGAPKLGDVAAWQPRIAKGMEMLYANAINGVKTMPPKGGNGALTDEEMKAAVDYMASKSK